jgi:acyl dehydratase
MLDKSLIGKKYPEFSFEVEKGKIREFARAIGDNNPVYFDEEAAIREGFGGLIAPPTFGTVIYVASEVIYSILNDLKVDLVKMLQAGQEYEYFKPIKPGDTITQKTKIMDIFEKTSKAGKMYFVIIGTNYINQNGEKALGEKLTVVIRE